MKHIGDSRIAFAPDPSVALLTTHYYNRLIDRKPSWHVCPEQRVHAMAADTFPPPNIARIDLRTSIVETWGRGGVDDGSQACERDVLKTPRSFASTPSNAQCSHDGNRWAGIQLSAQSILDYRAEATPNRGIGEKVSSFLPRL